MDTSSEKIYLITEIAPIFIITIFLLIVATGIIMLALVYQKKQVQYLREREQLKVVYEKEILATQLEIQEQTFKNISQEVHDNIGQVLSLVKLNINTMDTNDPAQLRTKINASKELITKAIKDLRDLSKSLNTDYVKDLGLERSIEYELEMIKNSGTYEIQFDVKGNKYRLESQRELILFRIVQEVLHNIIKHAKATSIAMALSYDPAKFSLTVTDNGVGFDASEIDSNNPNGCGLGIRNMYNRAKIINGAFKLTSTLGAGTTITLTLTTPTETLNS
ncbi:MAG: histidine kinase [Bacteroidota bacterium]|nr:histidine kinase [Bacteroidota bacterium]